MKKAFCLFVLVLLGIEMLAQDESSKRASAIETGKLVPKIILKETNNISNLPVSSIPLALASQQSYSKCPYPATDKNIPTGAYYAQSDLFSCSGSTGGGNDGIQLNDNSLSFSTAQVMWDFNLNSGVSPKPHNITNLRVNFPQLRSDNDAGNNKLYLFNWNTSNWESIANLPDNQTSTTNWTSSTISDPKRFINVNGSPTISLQNAVPGSDYAEYDKIILLYDYNNSPLSISPASNNFGTVSIGSNSATQNFIISNTGYESIIVNVSLTGTNADQFECVSGCGSGITISGNSSKTISVRFKPTSTGLKNGGISVIPSLSEISSVSASLSGTGEPAPQLSLTPATYNFGSILVGNTSPKYTFILKNTGGGTATGSVSITGINSGEFQINTGGGSFSLTSNQTKSIDIVFKPTSSGSKNASLLVDVNNCSDVSSGLSGVGELPPQISLTPSSKTFGSVSVGNTSETFSFTLKNTGSGTATGSVSLTGTNSSEFQITSGGGSFSLTANQTKQIIVVFKPTSTGNKSANLFADGTNCEDASSSLSGTGILLSISGTIKAKNWPSGGLGGFVVQATNSTSGLKYESLASEYGTGNYLIQNLPYGIYNLNITNAADWSIQSSASNPLTVNNNQTVNYTLESRATPTVRIDVPSNYIIEQPFDITVYLKNTNYAVSSITGYLDISFPGNPQVVPKTIPSGFTTNVYNQGFFPIYHADGRSITVTDKVVMVEWKGTIGHNEEKAIVLTVTVPVSMTELKIWYRGTFGDKRDPLAGQTDQQGYFVKENIITPLLPPVITNFVINEDAATTSNPTVTLNNSCSNNPTHYMASENSTFQGASWTTYSSAPQFTLSSGNGKKTIYFKVKNNAGESVLYGVDDIELTLPFISGKITGKNAPVQGKSGWIIRAVNTSDNSVFKSQPTLSDGSYKIENVKPGSYNISVETNTNDYNVSTSFTNPATVISNITGKDFTIESKATPSVRIETPPNFTPGQQFDITVYLKNTNYAVSTITGYLDVSFPGNPDVVTKTIPTGCTANVYAPGYSPICHADGSEIAVRDRVAMIEWKGVIGNNEEKAIVLTVSPPVAMTEVKIWYRGTFGDKRDPQTGLQTDQQGYYVKESKLSSELVQVPEDWVLISSNNYNLFEGAYSVNEYKKLETRFMVVLRNNLIVTDRSLTNFILLYHNFVKHGYLNPDLESLITNWKLLSSEYLALIKDKDLNASEYWKKRLEQCDEITDIGKKVGFWGTVSAGAATGAVAGAVVGAAFGGLPAAPGAVIGGAFGVLFSGAGYAYNWFFNEVGSLPLESVGDEYFEQEYYEYLMANAWLKSKGFSNIDDYTFDEYNKLIQRYSNFQNGAEQLDRLVEFSLLGLSLFSGTATSEITSNFGWFAGATFEVANELVEQRLATSINNFADVIADKDKTTYIYFAEKSQRKHNLLLSYIADLTAQNYSNLNIVNFQHLQYYQESILNSIIARKMFYSVNLERDFSLALRSKQLSLSNSSIKTFVFETPEEAEVIRTLTIYNNSRSKYLIEKSRFDQTISSINDDLKKVDEAFINLWSDKKTNVFIAVDLKNSQLEPLPLGINKSYKIAFRNVSDRNISNLRVSFPENNEFILSSHNSNISQILSNSFQTFDLQISRKKNPTSQLSIITLNVEYQVDGKTYFQNFSLDIPHILPFSVVRVSSEKDIYSQGDPVKIYINVNSTVQKQISIELKMGVYGSNSVSRTISNIELTEKTSKIVEAELFLENNCKCGQYYINIILDDGINQYETSIPRLFWVQPKEIIGSIVPSDLNQIKIISSGADAEIAIRLNSAIENSMILYKEGLTAKDLLDAIQNDNLLLVGGDQANIIVEELVRNGKVPSNLWTESGDATLLSINNPFYPGLGHSGSRAIIVAGYSLEDTYAAGLKLIEILRTDKVSNPIFDPFGPLLFTSPFLLSISSSTPDAKVYYSLNGSTPDEESLTGSQILISQSTTVKARAYKPGMLPSDIVSSTYTLKSPINIAGNIQYLNSSSTPLPEINIKLKSQGITISTLVFSEEYIFNGINNGTYKLEAACTNPWGGVNATDALKVLLHTVGTETLSDLKLKAADVNVSGSVNATDALKILLRTVGNINSFEAGDWVFDNPEIIVNNSNVTQDIYGLCVGDVNGSYVPQLAKISSSLAYNNDNILTINPAAEFEIPVKVMPNQDIGAFTLVFKYPDELAEFAGVSKAPEGTLISENSGIIRIAWAGLTPVNTGSTGELICLKFKPGDLLKEGTAFIPELDPAASEIADSKGNILYGITVSVPSLQCFIPKEFKLSQNYPNPFNPSTFIEYELPEQAAVKLDIYNSLGELAATLVNSNQEPGSYKAEWKCGNLPSGTYLCRIEAKGISSHYIKVQKMILLK